MSDNRVSAAHAHISVRVISDNKGIALQVEKLSLRGGAQRRAPRDLDPNNAKAPDTPQRSRALRCYGSYLAFSRISTSRQRLVADSGRVSISETRSPTPAMPFSSCAFTLVVVRMILP